VSWASLGEVLPAGQWIWSFPSVQHWWGCTWSTGSSSRFPHTRHMDMLKIVHWMATEII